MNRDLVAVLIPAGLFLIGCGLIWFGMRNRKLALASKSWPSAPGKILSSRVVQYESNDSGSQRTTYQAEVEYEYAAGGQALRGKRVQFGGRMGTSNRAAQEVVTRYPTGTAVSVFYDPAKPSQCTLEQSASSSTIVLFIVGAAMLVISPLVGWIVIAFKD